MVRLEVVIPLLPLIPIVLLQFLLLHSNFGILQLCLLRLISKGHRHRHEQIKVQAREWEMLLWVQQQPLLFPLPLRPQHISRCWQASNSKVHLLPFRVLVK
jgi:hypothetical protein